VALWEADPHRQDMYLPVCLNISNCYKSMYQRTSEMSDGCFLCRFNNTSHAKLAQAFITDNAGCMTTHEMAADLAADLTVSVPDAVGIDRAMILIHIEEHSLNPNLRLSLMLRNLFKLSDSLLLNMNKVDESGNTTVDAKLVETYLKVQTQIMTIYKQNELNKLLFAGT